MEHEENRRDYQKLVGAWHKLCRGKMGRRKFITMVGSVLAGAAASSLAACAPKQTPAATATAAPTEPVATATAAPTAAPAVVKPKQEIIMGIGTDVKIIDPRIQQGGQAQSQIFHVGEPLVYANNEGIPEGILASAWEPILDPPGWRFKLRPGIKFHNGEPFNAESLKYTIDSIFDPANDAWIHPDPRSRLGSVKDVKIEDDLTVVIFTDGFDRMLPINMNMQAMWPPKYAAEKGEEFGVHPYGTGHYKFVEYRSQSHLHLEANPEYHGSWDGPTKNDSATFRYLTETATRMAALEAEEVHLIDNVPPDTLDRIKSNPNLDVLSTPSARICGMNFYCNREPFNNIKARMAVAHAIDKEAIVEEIMGGLTEVAEAPFPPGTLGTRGETFRPLSYDLEKAKQYFSEAGLTKGTKIKIGGPVGRYINDKQIVTAVAGMIAEIGFDPEIEQLEMGTYWPKASQGHYDVFYVGWVTWVYDPADFKHVYMGWNEDNAGMLGFVEQNERVVELYELANSTPSEEEAEGHYRELAHILWDAQPIAYMHYEPNIAAINKKLKGWVPRRDTYVFLWNAYLE
jgi:peptide/nickel transport system substrate-binding protein